MMRKHKHWSLVWVALAAVVTALCLFGTVSKAQTDVYEYEFESYSVDIQVMEDNVLHIKEKIHTMFHVSKHGIYRKIPVMNHVERADGSSSTVYAQISDISANVTKNVSYEDGNCVIRLGDKDRMMTGPVDYEISYTYDLDNDPLPDRDEFYFNIIGTEWKDTCISNVTFSIHMPKEFDENKLGFSRGAAGSTNYQGISYGIDGTTINGRLNPGETLNPGEALTVRLELPEGYFKTKKGRRDLTSILSIVCSVLAVGIAAFLWYKVGRDNPVIDVIEFEPPGDLNSLDLAFEYKGEASKEDVVSLVVYLANQGYLRIEEYEEKGLIGTKDSFRLVKEREYDGKNEAERVFFNGLFATRNIVTKKDLENSFYKTVNRVMSITNSKEHKRKIFYANSINKGKLLYLMMVVVLVLSLLPPAVYANGGIISSDALFQVLFPLIGIIVVAGMITLKVNLFSLIFILIWGAGFAGVPFVVTLLPAVRMKPIFIAAFVVSILSVIGISIFNKLMSRRTEYGTKILGRIRGFKQFLTIAEKARLEAMVAQNPNYFYDILPYAYVLDVSDEWMDKFESIAVDPPNWYSGNHGGYFSMHQFHSFMNQTMSSASSSMTSSPSSSGGGSSGGGSGGGGGGSW